MSDLGNFFRRLFRRERPADPVVGQIWRCGYNGSLMRVSEVSITDDGTTLVYVQREIGGPMQWGMATGYAIGLSDWRWSIRNERRTLMPEWPRQ